MPPPYMKKKRIVRILNKRASSCIKYSRPDISTLFCLLKRSGVVYLTASSMGTVGKEEKVF